MDENQLKYESDGFKLKTKLDFEIKNSDDIFLHPLFEKYNEDENRRIRIISHHQKRETGSLKCKKCGSFEVESYQVQTRSGDEAMTTYAHCIKCNTRFKF
jgi:DNA-directed RNA polymerase subunit M/transcription elongation factor TFIIS